MSNNQQQVECQKRNEKIWNKFIKTQKCQYIFIGMQ
jgi:hypothetical protein